MTTPGVDFFRVDRARPRRRAPKVGVLMVSFGGILVSAHLMHQLSTPAGRLVSLAGGLMMLAGLVTGFGVLALMLFENVYVLVRDGGLLLHENGKDMPVQWDEIEDLVARNGTVTIVRRVGEPLRFYGGRAASAIAAKLEEARRKGVYFDALP